MKTSFKTIFCLVICSLCLILCILTITINNNNPRIDQTDTIVSTAIFLLIATWFACIGIKTK